jgi:hypothetical protein
MGRPPFVPSQPPGSRKTDPLVSCAVRRISPSLALLAPGGVSFARLPGMASKQAASAKPSAATGSDELQKLRRGEMTFEEYLDIRAERAVESLRATVSAEQLELVRETVRAQLENDPNIAALVRRVTGRDPRTLGRS